MKPEMRSDKVHPTHNNLYNVALYYIRHTLRENAIVISLQPNTSSSFQIRECLGIYNYLLLSFRQRNLLKDLQIFSPKSLSAGRHQKISYGTGRPKTKIFQMYFCLVARRCSGQHCHLTVNRFQGQPSMLVFTVPIWVFSECSCFLPHHKHVQIRCECE